MKNKLPDIDGKTACFGVIGAPVAHSRSPEIHHYWFEKYGINARYLAFHVEEGNLAAVINGAKALGIRGLNVTVPHKEAILHFVDEIALPAQKIGAANTLFFKEGRAIATNTDAYGVVENLRQQLGAEKMQDCLQQVVVLGAGGAARAAVAGLMEAGATSITLTNRTRKKAEKLAADMQTQDGALQLVDWDAKEAALKAASLLINTTSLGMQHQPALEISLKHLPKNAVVYDIVYTPLMTDLLTRAKAQGNAIVTGDGMLLYQAQKAFHHWHAILPEVDADLRARLQT